MAKNQEAKQRKQQNKEQTEQPKQHASKTKDSKQKQVTWAEHSTDESRVRVANHMTRRCVVFLHPARYIAL